MAYENAVRDLTAEDVLTLRVYIPHFVRRCAELGISINDEGEMQAIMQVAKRVRTRKEAGHIPPVSRKSARC